MDVLRQSLEGKVGVVSGAGNGQGKAVVKLLLDFGTIVYAFSRNGNKPDLKNENLTVLRGDANDIENLERIRMRIEREHGIIHMLYNNQGKFSPLSQGFSGNVAEEFFRGNVAGSVNTIKVFSQMMTNGGSIVNVGASRSIYKHSSLEYTVSKYSVEELTRKAASLLKEKNIRVNAILPGGVDSSKEIDEMFPFGFTELRGRKEVSNLEIGYVALFLLSDLSHGITGQAINVDGGIGL